MARALEPAVADSIDRRCARSATRTWRSTCAATASAASTRPSSSGPSRVATSRAYGARRAGVHLPRRASRMAAADARGSRLRQFRAGRARVRRRAAPAASARLSRSTSRSRKASTASLRVVGRRRARAARARHLERDRRRASRCRRSSRSSAGSTGATALRRGRCSSSPRVRSSGSPRCRPLSDMLGFAVGDVGAGARGRRAVAARRFPPPPLLAGCAIGIRSQTAVLTLPFLAYTVFSAPQRRPRRSASSPRSPPARSRGPCRSSSRAAASRPTCTH